MLTMQITGASAFGFCCQGTNGEQEEDFQSMDLRSHCNDQANQLKISTGVC